MFNVTMIHSGKGVVVASIDSCVCVVLTDSVVDVYVLVRNSVYLCLSGVGQR